ncbi:MAG: PEP-CTERM sorting domain-containing protein [Phycisphaerales bacterium]|nr:PEP-CTERM sorting domain-containing protein [Phycisphaerales bacterium]
MTVAILLQSSLTMGQSSTMVKWWNDYIPDDRFGVQYRSRNPFFINGLDLNNDGQAIDSLSYYSFSMTDPLNPKPPVPGGPSEHIYHADKTSGVFFGGIVSRYLNRTISSAALGMAQSSVQIDGAHLNPDGTPWNGLDPRYPHSIPRFQTGAGPNWEDMTLFVTDPWNPLWTTYRATPGAGTNFTALWMWKKEGFLNGLDEGPVGFNSDSKMSVDLIRHWWNVEDGRFVVQDDQGFWISQATVLAPVESSFNSPVAYFGATVEINPTETLWAAYYPQGLYDIEFDPTNAIFTSRTFVDIQATGIYFASYEYLNDIQAINFDNFEVTAIIVPEPAALTLCALGGLLIFGRRRSHS